MAKLQKSAVVLRFRLGQGLVKARQRYSNTARAILERVAFTFAEDSYDNMRKTLEQRVEQDVRAELVHLARLFRRYIIGAAGTLTQPGGTMSTVAKGAGQPSMTIASGLPPWQPRSAKYLSSKRAATGHIKWFDNRGWKTHRDPRFSGNVMTSWKPHRTGLMFKEMRADTWETMFGPIGVRFYRSRKLDAHEAQSKFNLADSKKIKIQIGTLHVRALGNLTPSMLPGYTTGTVHASNAGNPGLIGLIHRYDPDLAIRMGPMRNGIYRPTLEPFLGFFLTRALPHAVRERIRKGSLGSLVRFR